MDLPLETGSRTYHWWITLEFGLESWWEGYTPGSVPLHLHSPSLCFYKPWVATTALYGRRLPPKATGHVGTPAARSLLPSQLSSRLYEDYADLFSQCRRNDCCTSHWCHVMGLCHGFEEEPAAKLRPAPQQHSRRTRHEIHPEASAFL